MSDLFCPTFVQTGNCPNLYCPFNHTICLLCQKSGLSRAELYNHIRTKTHLERLHQYQTTVSWRCPVCNITMVVRDRAQHEQGASHISKLVRLSAPAAPAVSKRSRPDTKGPKSEVKKNPRVEAQEAPQTESGPSSRGARVNCGLCETSVARQEWSQHLYDPVHVRKARLVTYHQALKEGSRDKLGISIVTGDMDFGIVELDSLTDWPTREDSFYVQVEESGYRIKSIQMTSRLSNSAEFRDTRYAIPDPSRFTRWADSMLLVFRSASQLRYHSTQE